jgi:hypothetical protein
MRDQIGRALRLAHERAGLAQQLAVAARWTVVLHDLRELLYVLIHGRIVSVIGGFVDLCGELTWRVWVRLEQLKRIRRGAAHRMHGPLEAEVDAVDRVV